MRTFLISDHHFGHSNILTFKRNDGTNLRDFKHVDEMDEYMVDAWNSKVKPGDKVYHLGDVAFKPRMLDRLYQCNGEKVLIKGNHDTLKASQYLTHFKDIRAYWVLDKILLAHVPIHPESLSRWKGQVHGHTHANNMKDRKYFNVSVENVNYFPVDFEEIRDYFANQC